MDIRGSNKFDAAQLLDIYRPYVEQTAVTLPNEASLKLHQKVGFEPLGVFESVGRKFGRWHDVAWLRRLVRVDPLED